jgi:hypothetical protein
MTREQAKELLPIIQAFAEGKEIQSSPDGVNWFNCSTPTFSPHSGYRIKPEPREFWARIYPEKLLRGALYDERSQAEQYCQHGHEIIKVREVI